MQNDAPDAALCIGYILSYRAPDYIRTRTLLRALQNSHGLRVVTACNVHSGFKRYLETLHALRHIRAVSSPDAYILGFRGHEIFYIVRRIISRKPLIFDALMSPYAALKEEGKWGSLGRLIAPILYYVERYALKCADLVLTDTNLHADYYAKVFGLPHSKIVAVPVGAIEVEPEHAVAVDNSAGDFTVLFYGSFLKLHGIDLIMEAAGKVRDLPIRFDLVGGSRRQAGQLRRRCRALGVTQYTHRRWVPFARLLTEDIPHATLCLGGPFGGTDQARRVITGKTSQFLALGKATVVGRTEEVCGFADRSNCILVEQGSAESLAEAIRWAYRNRDRLHDIGARGRTLYEARLSVRVVTQQLRTAFKKIGLLPESSLAP